MDEYFDDTAAAARDAAAARAVGDGRPSPTVVDLFDVLVERPAPAELLTASGVDASAVRRSLQAAQAESAPLRGDLWKRTIERSLREALQQGKNRVSDVAVLLALLHVGARDGHERAVAVLRARQAVPGGPVPAGATPFRSVERRLSDIEAKLDLVVRRLSGA